MSDQTFLPPVDAHFPMHLLSPDNLLDARLGAHDYDIVVGLMTRFHPHLIAMQLAAHFCEDFDAAAKCLDKVDYQVMRLSGCLSIFRLADPLFNAAESLCVHLETEDALEKIESDLIADAIDVRHTLAALAKKLQALKADQGKAVWASLVFGQTALLTDYELLMAPWWTSSFIRLWASEAT